MTKSKKITLISLLCAVFCLLIFGFSPVTSVMADTTAPDINATNYSDVYNFDKTLYDAVKMLAKQLNNNQPVAGFNITLFSTDYASCTVESGYYVDPTTGEKVPSSTEGAEYVQSDGEKLKEDLSNGLLDLTTGTNARYKCLINRSKIKNITGLNSLNLSNIKTLILNDNSIITIKSTDLETLTALNTLELSNNKLTSFSLNPDLDGVNVLDLSNNQLTSCDLSNLAVVASYNPSCDLSNNYISSLNDITFPNSNLLGLNLAFNNLQLTDEEYATLKSKVATDNLTLLVQGVSNTNNNVLAGTKMFVYPDSNVQTLQVKIFYSTDSMLYVSGEENLITSAQAVNQIEQLYLPAGKIKVAFYINNLLVNADNFPSLSNQELNMLSEKQLYVTLSSPTYEAFHDNKKIKDLNQEGDITLNFAFGSEINLLPNKEDILSSSNKAKIIVKQDGKEVKLNNNSFVINENGKYDFKCFVEFDNLQSQEIDFKVNRQNYVGISIGLAILILILVVIVSGVFIVKWIKGGANVAPLSDKEVYSLKKRQARKQEFNREDYIADLDKPRHDKKVTDYGYSDDSLVNKDLNKVSNSEEFNSFDNSQNVSSEENYNSSDSNSDNSESDLGDISGEDDD